MVVKAEIESPLRRSVRRLLRGALERLVPCAEDGLVELTPGGVRATPLGRIFLRNLAMPFDAYLASAAREAGLLPDPLSAGKPIRRQTFEPRPPDRGPRTSDASGPGDPLSPARRARHPRTTFRLSLSAVFGPRGHPGAPRPLRKAIAAAIALGRKKRLAGPVRLDRRRLPDPPADRRAGRRDRAAPEGPALPSSSAPP